MNEPVESVLQKSREEFEKWAAGLKLPLGRIGQPWVSQIYTEYMTQLAWQGWQASRSALEPTLAELKEERAKYGQGYVKEHRRAEAAEQALREARDINHDLASTRFAKWKQLRAENEKLRELLREITHALKSSFAGKNVRCADELISRAEALSPSPTPAQPYKPLIKSDRKHVHLDLNEFQDEAKPSPDSATPPPHEVEYLRAKEPGLCIICAARIHTGELIHIGESGGVPVAAHHECVQANHADAQKYNMLGGHSS